MTPDTACASPTGRVLTHTPLRDVRCDGATHHVVDLVERCRCEEGCDCRHEAGATVGPHTTAPGHPSLYLSHAFPAHQIFATCPPTPPKPSDVCGR